MKLTEKQRRFVEAYMGEAKGNATEAARLAGYKGNNDTLRCVGSENLAKPYVAEAIRKLQDECPLVLSREELQRFLARVVRGEEMQTVIVKTEDGPEAVQVPPSLKERLSASDQAHKTWGAYLDRKQHTVESEARIVFCMPPLEDEE